MLKAIEYITSHPTISMILKIVIIAVLTLVVNLIIKRVYRYGSSDKSLYKKFTYNIIVAVVYLAGILFIVGQIPQLSKVTQTILAGSGIIALALSLSAQESLNNVISGMFITLFKPFEVGDRVTLVNNKITGTIEDITLRHTVIKTFVNSRVVVPNSTMNKEIIENSNLIDSKASSFIDIQVAYEADIDKAMEIMASIIAEHPLYIDTRTDEEKTTQPIVRIYIRELGNSSIILRANMWTQTVNDNFEACSDVRLQIKKEFDYQGIEIPYTKFKIITQEMENTNNGDRNDK